MNLTPKELQVLRRKAVGLMDKQIADEMSLSTETIRTYIWRIRKKLNVTGNLCSVVLKAERAGLLQGVEV